MVLSAAEATEIASQLLQINAIKLSPETPFTWASGWQAPIYCDNRLSLSYPDVRDKIKSGLSAALKEKFPKAQLIAGVATAGIPHAAILADALKLPLVYVRSNAKEHGLSNQIEGKVEGGEKVVVVEDLISTGGSSLSAVESLREAGAEVLGLLAIFDYGFETARQNFEEADCPYFTLSDYPHLIKVATEKQLIPAGTGHDPPPDGRG